MRHEAYLVKPFQVYNADYCVEREAASLDHNLHRAQPIKSIKEIMMLEAAENKQLHIST